MKLVMHFIRCSDKKDITNEVIELPPHKTRHSLKTVEHKFRKIKDIVYKLSTKKISTKKVYIP
jgi:hypothetical protein